MGLTVPVEAAQAAQVVTVAAGAPWVSGVIGRVEARLQGRRGLSQIESPRSNGPAAVCLPGHRPRPRPGGMSARWVGT